MGAPPYVRIALSALAIGIAASAVAWVLLDMFADYQIVGSWSGFAGMALIAAAIASPFFVASRRAQTRCVKCGAAWTREESGREDVRRYRRRKDDEFETEEYWQTWTCTACGDVTRRKFTVYNPDGKLAGD